MFKRFTTLPLYIITIALLSAATPPLAAADDATLEVPGRAWTKTRVEQVFGTPRNKRGPVGQPPITTWEYANFNVYFEYNRVIHSVKHYRAAN